MPTTSSTVPSGPIHALSSTMNSPPVAAILRLEALVVLALSLGVYSYLGSSWWLFALLVLAPDLAALGFVGGSSFGAWCYDMAHTYLAPALLAAAGFVMREPLVMALAAIWFAHIGFDRLIGYGLKFGGNSKDTHLTRLTN